MDTYTFQFDASEDSAEEIIELLQRKLALPVEDYGDDWIEVRLTPMDVDDVERVLTDAVIWFEWW